MGTKRKQSPTDEMCIVGMLDCGYILYYLLGIFGFLVQYIASVVLVSVVDSRPLPHFAAVFEALPLGQC